MISSGNLDAAKAEVKAAISALDKEAEKGKVHRNNAARRKSRLMKKLNKAAAASKTEKKEVTSQLQLSYILVLSASHGDIYILGIDKYGEIM